MWCDNDNEFDECVKVLVHENNNEKLNYETKGGHLTKADHGLVGESSAVIGVDPAW